VGLHAKLTVCVTFDFLRRLHVRREIRPQGRQEAGPQEDSREEAEPEQVESGRPPAVIEEALQRSSTIQ
jgi:hypothetical protein